MKSTFKKIGALVLALVMVLSMSVVAFADTQETSEKQADSLTFSASGTNIPKQIAAYNVDGLAIYEPNVTYTYTLTSVGIGAWVQDYQGNKGNIKQGLLDAVNIQGNDGTAAGNTATLVFGTGDSPVTASKFDVAKGNAVVFTKNISVTFVPANFVDSTNGNVLMPGIYRYLLTETSNTIAGSGVERVDTGYVTAYYLDVYVRWTDTNRNALEVYGLIMFKANDNIDGYDDTNAQAFTTDASFKVTGFDQATEGTNMDMYKTYNVTVKKLVDGSLADTNHKFPFAVTLSNAENTKQADFHYTITGGTQTAAALAANGSWSIGTLATGSVLKLKAGEEIAIVGLPKTTLVMVSEMNDTVDIYTASATETEASATNLTLNDGTNEGTSLAIAVNGTVGMKTTAAVDYTDAKNLITFTNTLTEISPTGVVLRVAPYALMLGAGLFLVLFTRRRKEENEA